MRLGEGAVFKAEKVKKKYIDNIRPPRGLLRGFDQAFFEENFWEILDGRSEKNSLII